MSVASLAHKIADETARTAKTLMDVLVLSEAGGKLATEFFF